MKLYDLDRNDKFILVDAEDTLVPVCAASPREKEVYTFKHLDGMYSYILDSEENVCHFAAFTQVVKV